MWPQLGQGVSDHSQVFGDKANFLERGARTRVIITSTVYAAAAEASKTGLKIRNYHKSVKGSMPGGSDYHALNPETYYWAHATFLDGVYRYVDWFGRRPLTPAEKEQLFEESKEWFSLYGVDDVAQPESYTDFVSYFDDVVNNQLIDSSVAQYSLGFAHKPLPAPPGTPAMIAQLVWPRITALIRLTNIGVLHPVLRERLGLTWTDADQRNFERVSKLSRALAPVLERLPLKFRYERVAVEAFERVGIDPDRITLETARAALARARSAAADAVR
ncbi:hypothetical protein BOO86_21525 [Mycobacterium sp. CBMA 234]|nr:hypothetical protein [Mycolicibacterium sp. CBMA 234]